MNENLAKALTSGFTSFMIERYGAKEDIAIWHGSIVDTFIREFLDTQGYEITKKFHVEQKEPNHVSELVQTEAEAARTSDPSDSTDPAGAYPED